MFNVRHFYYFTKRNLLILNLIASTCLKKVRIEAANGWTSNWSYKENS